VLYRRGAVGLAGPGRVARLAAWIGRVWSAPQAAASGLRSAR